MLGRQGGQKHLNKHVMKGNKLGRQGGSDNSAILSNPVIEKYELLWPSNIYGIETATSQAADASTPWAGQRE